MIYGEAMPQMSHIIWVYSLTNRNNRHSIACPSLYLCVHIRENELEGRSTYYLRGTAAAVEEWVSEQHISMDKEQMIYAWILTPLLHINVVVLQLCQLSSISVMHFSCVPFYVFNFWWILDEFKWLFYCFRHWHGCKCNPTTSWWPFPCSNHRLLLPSGRWSLHDG